MRPNPRLMSRTERRLPSNMEVVLAVVFLAKTGRAHQIVVNQFQAEGVLTFVLKQDDYWGCRH